MNKLVAIFCVWDDYELLRCACDNIKECVDEIIIIYSLTSNYRETSYIQTSSIPGYVKGFQWEPTSSSTPHVNETEKRNYGLKKAMELGATHFVCMDADEFYNPIEFKREWKRFETEPDLQGLVCELQTYFKSPTLTIGKDITRVPFIHKLTPTIQHTFNKRYPFAWERNQIRIDPTRSLNINAGVKMSSVTMHHYSYIRSDLNKKVRNSTARANIERSTTLFDDYRNAIPGYYCKFYERTLHEVPNYFNLPELIDPTI